MNHYIFWGAILIIVGGFLIVIFGNSKEPSELTLNQNGLVIMAPIIIAFIALIFAYQANNMAKSANDIYKEELRLTHRPFVVFGTMVNNLGIDKKNWPNGKRKA